MPRFSPEDIRPGLRAPPPEVTRRVYQFRVRVIRQGEAYIDVEAESPLAAEAAATGQFGVVSVFTGSAIRTDLSEPLTKSQYIEGVIGDGSERSY